MTQTQKEIDEYCIESGNLIRDAILDATDSGHTYFPLSLARICSLMLACSQEAPTEKVDQLANDICDAILGVINSHNGE